MTDEGERSNMSPLDRAVDAMADLLDRAEDLTIRIADAAVEGRSADAARLRLELREVDRDMVRQIYLASKEAGANS